MGSYYLMGTEFSFARWKDSGEEWWWLYNIMKDESTEFHLTVYLKRIKIVNFMLMCFYHSKKLKKRTL